jgi:acyl-CoA thioester hydrolase
MEPVPLPPLDLEDLEVPHPRPFALRHVPDASVASRGIPHVNNVAYVGWLDRAAELHADALGWTREAMAAEDLAWFVGRHEIEYRAEAWPGDELLLLTWIRRMHRVTAEREVLVLRTRAADAAPGRPDAAAPAAPDAAPVPICRGRSTWVLVTLSSRRPRRHDAAMIEAFAPLEAGPAGARG